MWALGYVAPPGGTAPAAAISPPPVGQRLAAAWRRRRRRAPAPPPHRALPAACSAAPPLSDGDDDAGESAEDARWADLAAASVRAQQAAGAPRAAPLAETRALVETAMLAAATALGYTLAVLLRLEGYASYALPLPAVVAALRNGAAAGAKCVAVAALLLAVLQGPVRAAGYALVYGVLSLALGAAWRWRWPWAASVPAAAAARIAGYWAYVALSSALTGEDLLALMVGQVHALLAQLAGAVGAAGAPSRAAVGATLASLLLVNSLVYVTLTHVLYAILLRAAGLEAGPSPRWVRRWVPEAAPGLGRG